MERAMKKKGERGFEGLVLAGFAATALVGAAYFSFVWLYVDAAPLRLALYGFGVFFTACELVLAALLRRRAVYFTKALEADLDAVLAHSRFAAHTGQDTLLGKLEHKLERVTDILEAAAGRNTREKEAVQRLVSDIAHQVKTPIANIRMYSEILASRPVEAAQREEFLTLIGTQAERLGFLTDSLVALSRLETGAIQLVPQPVELAPLLAGISEGVGAAAQEKQIELTVSCPGGLCCNVDERWTAEALHNIIENAIKYTGPGGRVDVEAEGWEQYCRITVSDNGPGIPEAQHAAVFRRFVRGSVAAGVPGTGLGLYLAREVVARQGGYILLRSAAGEGAVFSVFLPR